jgi:hypothetical protein
LRFVFAGALVVVGIFLLSLAISSIGIGDVQAKERKSPSRVLSGSPNAVTSGMTRAAHDLGGAADSLAYATLTGIHSTATAITDGGMAVAGGIKTGTVFVATVVGKGVLAIGQGVGKGLAFTAGAVGTGAGFLFGIPGNAAVFASNMPVVQAVIKPADHEEVPIINPDSPELREALAALPPVQNARPTPTQSGEGPVWPIRGDITTGFGVPHWPFQRTHTGIDIIDHAPSGATPIRPFRPGRVINTIHSSRGFGNHVIVDHGNGVTSLYAHLASIAVQVGQEVGTNTTLGYEGSTGMSTGTHLHFEIRVNGQAADPRQFISGNP